MIKILTCILYLATVANVGRIGNVCYIASVSGVSRLERLLGPRKFKCLACCLINRPHCRYATG